MFDFVALEYYSSLYYHYVFLIMIILLFQSFITEINSQKNIQLFSIIGYFTFFLLIFYIGNRPISGKYFGDTSTYASYYDKIQHGINLPIKSDFLFKYYMKFSSTFLDVKNFFLLTAFLYIIPLYIFSKKYFKKYWFYVFIMFIGSFSFWGAGTNGIRNSLATSIFILALCFYDKKILMYAVMAVAFGIHNSLIIPIVAFIISLFIKNPKWFFIIWLVSIPLSLFGGNFWQTIFANLFQDDRIGYLTKNADEKVFQNTGFRWDFVLYSASAVFAGYYYVIKKNVKDIFYNHLLGTYIIANAFWILVIRANYSNRFAYLSWFLMAIIIGYPMLKYKLWNDQHKSVGIIVFLYYLFTYFMFLYKN